MGLDEADVKAPPPPSKLDRKNPPNLSFENYKVLKGIDFSDNEKLKQMRSKETDEEWQQQLDQMREDTQRDFKFSKEQLEQIAEHEIDVEKKDRVDYSPIRDSQMASSFGNELGADDSEAFDYTTVPSEDFYDPAAFPHALSMDGMVPKKVKGKCIFCLPDPSKTRVKEIVYTNVQLLHGFINERGMITSRRYNYNCSKHQRKVAEAVKQARFIGLLSFMDNFYVPESFAKHDLGGDSSQLTDMEMGLFDQAALQTRRQRQADVPVAEVDDAVEEEEIDVTDTQSLEKRNREKELIGKDKAKEKKRVWKTKD